MPNYQPINPKEHQQLKVKSDPSYQHSQQSHVVPLSVFELAQAQADYPIVLVKDGQTGAFHLVALLGLAPKQNLFCQANAWAAEYIPQYLKTHPFALSTLEKNQQQEAQQIVVLDQDSNLVNDSEGEALFNEQGQPSAWLNEKMELLANINAQNNATLQFIELLVKHELIAPQSLTVTTKQQQELNLTGLYIIDSDKFEQLSEAAYSELKQHNVIASIYAMIFSQHRVSKLIELS